MFIAVAVARGVCVSQLINYTNKINTFVFYLKYYFFFYHTKNRIFDVYYYIGNWNDVDKIYQCISTS